MTPEMIDIWGHVGYLSMFIGMVMISTKNANGWLLRLCGEFVWVVLGFVLGFTSLWTWGLLFMGVDISAWHLWKRNHEDF
ncbi:MAG: hypothetical protein MN733_29610 [Nitrososphaera sp.]|nr:hypothetical protein [Nitrososphaera sp.]